MKKILLPLIALSLMLIGSMTLTSCTAAKKEVKTAILNATVPVVAKYGDCQNSEAIKADFDRELSKHLKLTETQAEGEGKAALRAVCEVAVAAVLPSVIAIGGDKLPEAWDCQLTTISATALGLAKEACGKIK